jgi:DNA-binding response OmpR family regulator
MSTHIYSGMSNTQTPTKILIVEDNTSLASIYDFKFSHEGFEVTIADNGAAGLALAEQIKPDLILLDLRMPVMNGDEMLQKLRSVDWGADIRVMILTNISRDEAPRSLGVLNVERYIVKAHHTPAQVVNIVRESLGLA